MAVKIRMKKMGRKHRPFFRICAADCRSPRDGKVIEELGTYDPMLKEKDARVVLNSERIDYWLSVGAQPSDNVRVFIKKYGTDGTHIDQQQAALEKLKLKPMAPEPVAIPLPKKEEEPAAEAPAEDAKADAKAPAADAAADAAPEAAATTDEKPAEEAAKDAPAEKAKEE